MFTTEEEMEGPISFWGYKEQESNLILPEHDDDDIMFTAYVVPKDSPKSEATVSYFIRPSTNCTYITFEISLQWRRSYQNVLEASRTGNIQRPDICTIVFKCIIYIQ